MKILFGAKTDTGRVRKENQDSYGIAAGKGVYFLCDGMGGGAAGDFASRYAVEVMLRSLDLLKEEEVLQIAGRTPGIEKFELLSMVSAIRLANRALSNLSAQYPKLSGMGTTLTSVYFDSANDMMHIFHVGDSRVYRLSNGAFELLTKDHSKVNELLDQGKMTEDEVKTAEIQSMITRALGTAPKVKVDYRPEHVNSGDCFVLCTDGLNGEIDDMEIGSFMAEYLADPEMITVQLVSAANNAGGRDNVTVIALTAYDEKQSAKPRHAFGPGEVITVGEETPEETRYEDRSLKKLMNDAKTRVPKTARQKSLMSNPLILGALIALVVGLFGHWATRYTRDNNTYDKELTDLAGKVTGLKVEVREPLPEQYETFKKSDDTVAKLQIIQDWYRDSKYTLPLSDVGISISDGKKEQFKGSTAGSPLEIKLEKGAFTVKVSHPGYRLVTEKMEIKDSMNIIIEPSMKDMPIMLVMIPEK